MPAMPAMTSPTAAKRSPQSFASTYAPRIRAYNNSLLTPVVPPANTQLPPVRTTKRGTTAINYAEDGLDDDDFDESDGPSRRPTGLRSLRREEPSTVDRGPANKELGKEIAHPVEVQVWFECSVLVCHIGFRAFYSVWGSTLGTEKQQQTQSMLPLHLIPIRIDVDIQSFRPEPSFPLPSNPRDYGIDESHPAYRQPEPTPAYRLKDSFLWNLHEALITPDQFARVLVDELDFSHEKKMTLILEIAKQIREQLEQSAGVVLHPHFADSNGVNTHAPNVNGTHTSNTNGALSSGPQHNLQPITNGITSHAASSAPTPTTNGTAPHPPLQSPPKSFTATASQPVPSSDHQDHSPRRPLSPIHNPDDTHRCILTLSINLLNDLYTDRFEWSLLHPPGLAEHFARITAADLGLPGEWAAAIAHAIYEAVLRLKKEVLENGGQLLLYGEIDNDAAPTAATTSEADGTPAGFAQQSEAGWRYDPEHLGAFWAPRVEALSKEEIEKREGDRERQLRRARRERERYSTAILGPRESDFFGTGQDESVTLGRGERSKKKKRYRSLSPLGGDSPDPGQNAPGSGAGPGGTVPLGENERNPWRCSHCSIWGPAVWGVKEGPAGPKSLCPNCGMFWEKEGRLPVWNKGLFKDERGGWVGSSAAPIGTGLRR